MAVITPSSFDPLKTRCNVRLQQGVPILDADWNELDDIRRFERRAFAKWFVGDGVPDGNDGFRIDAIGAADDFAIRAGGGTPPAGASNVDIALRNVGRVVVDGLDVIIQNDVNFKAQAAPVGASAIAPIPVIAGAVTVYLDVWERLVTSQEEPSLVLAGLGTESCARMKRAFAVRARTGTAVPVFGDSDFASGHAYYALATINRRLSAPNVAAPIAAADLTDRRERRLATVPATLVNDALGVSAIDYRRGTGRPAMSLRDAINALIRGELPGTPVTPIAPDLQTDFMTYGLTFDSSGSATIVWHSNRVGAGANNQVFASRWDPAAPAAGFTTAVPITTGPVVHAAPHSVLLPTGDLLAVYTAGASGAETVVFKRGAGITALAASAESPVAGAAGDPKRRPFAVVTGTLAGGGVVVFFWHEALPTPRWAYRRRQYTPSWTEADAKWTDAAGLPLSTVPAPQIPLPEAGGNFHAMADGAGNVWAAITTTAGNDIQVVRLTPSTGALSPAPPLTSGAEAADIDPFVLLDASNSVWAFWVSDGGVFSQRFQPGTVTPDGAVTLVPGTNIGDPTTRHSPSAALDPAGAIWLFWVTDGGTPPAQVYAIRRDPVTQSWGQLRRLTASIGTEAHSRTFAATGPNGVLWTVFKRVAFGGTTDLFFRQIVTSI